MFGELKEKLKSWIGKSKAKIEKSSEKEKIDEKAEIETKDKAENTLWDINCSISKSAGKELPQFTIKQIKLIEL